MDILTKGDDNRVNDRGLYEKGKLWLKKEDIEGNSKSYFIITIVMFS